MGRELATVKAGYDRWAAVYDHDANPLVAMEDPVVRAAAGEVRGLKVLDLGCGTGRHALWLAGAGAEVTAVDFSEGMLAQARAKPGGDQVRWLVHDLHEPLPMAAGAFDLVVSGLVLEHLEDPGRVFAEAFRVLKPGSRAVVSAMHPEMFTYGVQARFTDPDTGEKVQPGSLPHSEAEFLAAARGAGFQVVRVGGYAADPAFAARFPRAARHVGRLMLLVMEFGRP